MATYYVVCIDKHPTHADPNRRIEQIGTNEQWDAEAYTRLWSVAQVVSSIESGHVFYSTDVKGEWALCVVAEHDGSKYVKTVPDGIQPNNLLAKPDCGR